MPSAQRMSKLIDEQRRAQTEVDRHIALVERAGIGVCLAAKRHFLRRAVVKRGIQRRSDTGRVPAWAFQFDIQPMIAIRRGIVDVNALARGDTALGRVIGIDQIQIAVQVDVAPGAVVTAGAGIRDALCRRHIGEFPPVRPDWRRWECCRCGTA